MTAVSTPATQPRSHARRALDVLDDRLGITALKYPVPEHANNLAWSLGGVTAAALVILIASGVVLVQFYNPVPESANHLVQVGERLVDARGKQSHDVTLGLCRG